MRTPPHLSVWFVMVGLLIVVTGCGGGTQATPIPRPTLTPTPRSTPLPPVPTIVPVGSAQRPYKIALFTTDRSATGSRFSELVTTETALQFEADVFSSGSDALAVLCGDRPAVALLDGRAALAAVAQGCGKLVFKLTDSEGNFGVKADIIARQGGNPSVNTLRDLRGRDFCRLSGTDIQSWILPMLSMRTGGVNPAAELKGIKEYGSVEMMVQGVADGICGGAGIPAGTLSTYKPRITTGQLIVLTTTPELPYGGLLISNTVPSALSDQLVKLIKDNPASLSSVLGTSKLVDAKPDDFSDFLRFADNAGLNLKTMQ